jgi:alkylhydroperoxidase/carboxymuconolactone decarboxylase family protein YurZ
MTKDTPNMFQTLRGRHPQIIEAVEQLGETVRREGPLEHKHTHLIQLAAAAAIRSEGAVHSHTRRALESGATAEEIRHALLLLVSTIGFPTVVAALSWAEDLLSSESPS